MNILVVDVRWQLVHQHQMQRSIIKNVGPQEVVQQINGLSVIVNYVFIVKYHRDIAIWSAMTAIIITICSKKGMFQNL